ncbi:MAG: hypothetical protein IT462_03860 [Planctomycetes bacterium]|nr:hypothetical protein [Planctomycetota bacterium]
MRAWLTAVILAVLLLPLAAQEIPGPDRYNGDKNQLPLKLKDTPGAWSNFTLSDKLRCDKDDTRTDMRQIGVRPAFVMLVQVPPQEKSWTDPNRAVKNCIAAIRLAEGLAGKMPDVECWVILANRNVIPSADAIKGAGVTKTVVAIAEFGYSLCDNVPGLRFTYMENDNNARFVARNGDDKIANFYYEWMWMPRPAEVTVVGDEIDEAQILKLAAESKEALAPVLKDRKAETFLRAASVGNYKAAGKVIGELRALNKEGKPNASEDVLGILNGLVVEMEEIMRDYCITHSVKEYYYAEAAEALDGIVELNKGQPRADEVAKELAKVKSKPEYKACVEAKPIFEKLKRKWEAVVVPFDTYDSVKVHYEKILKAYGPLKAEIEAFQKKYKGVGYQAQVGKWAEKLNDADARAKKAAEEGK